MERETIPVTGMSCDACERTVENALRTLEGVNRVDADHEADAVEVVAAADVSDEALHDAVDGAGYDVSV